VLALHFLPAEVYRRIDWPTVRRTDWRTGGRDLQVRAKLRVPAGLTHILTVSKIVKKAKHLQSMVRLSTTRAIKRNYLPN
jgi:hypothetical protein